MTTPPGIFPSQGANAHGLWIEGIGTRIAVWDADGHFLGTVAGTAEFLSLTASRKRLIPNHVKRRRAR